MHRFLIDYDMAMLRVLAQVRGVALATNRQPEAVDQLATALLDPGSVRVALASLSPRAREALDSLQAAGGRMRAPQFGRRFGSVRPIGSGRLEREAPWKEPANPTEELWYTGLIYRAFYQDKDGPGEFMFIPADLLPLLPQPQIEPPTFTVQTIPTALQQQVGEQSLIHDLFTYLVYLYTHDVRPYADGRLGHHDLATLRRRMGTPEDRPLAFLRHLAEQLGFVARQGEFLRIETMPVKRWLTAAPGHQLAALQEAWRDDPTWNDLCRVPSLICDQETPWHNDPVATRQALLALLARCPLEAWWSVSSFVAAVKETHPDFQRPDGDYMSWYIRDAGSGEYLSGFESWDRVEGILIADLLVGPLGWLGVVASVTGNLGTVCRLTEAGALFLGLVSGEPQASPSPPIVVRPDFCVELPAPVDLYIRFQLERFADLQGRDPCLYRLTVSSLGRALARDVRVEQVLAFLRQASDGKVPANVAGQLQMWAARFDQVQLEEVALLRVRSERVMRELSVLPETRSLIGRVLSPTTAMVRRQDLPRLRKELRTLGYLREQADDEFPKGG